MINEQHLAEKLKSFRKQRELSQTTLAELVGLRQKDISHMETCTGNSIDSISKVCLYADACNIPYPLLFENEIDTGLSNFGYNVNEPIVLPSDHQIKGDDDNMKNVQETQSTQPESAAIKYPDYLKGTAEDTLLSSTGDLRLSQHCALDTTKSRGYNVLVFGTPHDNYEFIEKNLCTGTGNYVVITTDVDDYEPEKCFLCGEGYEVVDISFYEKPNYDFFKELQGHSDEEIVRDVFNISWIIAENIDDSLGNYINEYHRPAIELLIYMYLLLHDTVKQMPPFVQYIEQVTTSAQRFEQELKSIPKNEQSIIWQHFWSDYKIWKKAFSSKRKFGIIASANDWDPACHLILSDVCEGLRELQNIHISTDKSLREVCKQDKFAIFITVKAMPSQVLDIPCNFVMSTLLDQFGKQAFNDRNNHKQVLGNGVKIFLNEFSKLPILQHCNLDTTFAIGIGQHISFIICLQSIHQLTGRYEETSVIIANTPNIVCSTIMSVQDRKFLRDMCGIRKFDWLTGEVSMVHSNEIEPVCVLDEKLLYDSP